MENQQEELGATPPNPEGLDHPSQANHIDFQEFRRGQKTGLPLKKLSVIALLVLVAAIVVAQPYLANNNNGGGIFGKKAVSGSGTYSVPLGGTPEFFLTEGQFQGFNFAGHRLLVNYSSASPDHAIDVTVDGAMKSIGIARNNIPCGENHCKFGWTYKGMNFSLEPVTRQNSEMSFDSWDTNELLFKSG